MSVEPIRVRAVARSGRGNHEARIAALETKVAAMQNSIANVEQNTGEILAVLTGTKTAFGYVQRYGRRVIIFGAGVMTTAGFGNPDVWKFITHFFGG